VHELHAWAGRHPGAVRRTAGTNDTTTWLLAPSNAAANLAVLQALAQEHNPAGGRSAEPHDPHHPTLNAGGAARKASNDHRRTNPKPHRGP
jgi:hypothetical protein